jgi:hypothetical protein
MYLIKPIEETIPAEGILPLALKYHHNGSLATPPFTAVWMVNKHRSGSGFAGGHFLIPCLKEQAEQYRQVETRDSRQVSTLRREVDSHAYVCYHVLLKGRRKMQRINKREKETPSTVTQLASAMAALGGN